MAHILVIDDDADLRGTLRRVLEHAGHAVREAENGVDGLRALEAEHPDLVITDLVMPEMEGIETIQALAERWPDLRILAISGAGGGEGDEGPLFDARLFGAHEALAKPFSIDVFLDAVNRLV